MEAKLLLLVLVLVSGVWFRSRNTVSKFGFNFSLGIIGLASYNITASLSDQPKPSARKRANKPPTIPTPVDRETPKFEAPAAMEGSQFPERLALREDFLQKEQLTETLAELPASQKVDLGFKENDLLVDCRYNGIQCSIKLVYGVFIARVFVST